MGIIGSEAISGISLYYLVPARTGVVAVVNLPACKVGNRGFVHRYNIQVSKKLSSPFTRKDSVFVGASVTER